MTDAMTKDDLLDLVDALRSELAEAVDVAAAHGALDWVAAKHPEHPALQSDTPAPKLEAKLRKVALAEREACLGVVGCAWAPITGTPYIAGPSKFCAAIRAMPDVAETSLPAALGTLQPPQEELDCGGDPYV